MLLLALALLAADTGTISGKVTIAGLAPKLANLPVTRDMKFCGTSKPDESLEVGERGGVKNVVVWLTDAPAPKKIEKKQKLDQQSCAFTPHVIAATVGSTLDVVNSDPVLHNARAQAGETRAFNYAMPIKGHLIPTRLKKDGFFKVSCDVHPWMRAWLVVLPSAAYAITDANGAYTLEGVPAGKHRIKTWHERLGEREDEVEVSAGATATHDVALNPR
jgi:plastocyanin